MTDIQDEGFYFLLKKKVLSVVGGSSDFSEPSGYIS